METRLYCNDRLYESGLFRIYAHAKRGFVILSSSIRDLTPKEEMNRFPQLKFQIKSAGLGFIELNGVWIDPNTKEEVHEPSLLVPFKDDGRRLDEFLNGMLEIANGVDQDAIVYGDSENIWLLGIKTRRKNT